MGYGRYSHAAHLSLTAPRVTQPQETVFLRRGCHPLMDPHGVTVRECRDSTDHPSTTGIIFALDVSGSMGDIPHRLATGTLPRFMSALLAAQITDPQLLFVAMGHVGGDAAPLQIGQFESTASLIDQWLTNLYIEGGGGGGRENYELAMYMVARHTAMDCVAQRGQRGVMFITGDEKPNPAVSRQHVRDIIGDDIPADIPIRDMITELQRVVEPFFLIPSRDIARRIERPWRDLLGDRVVVMERTEDTADVAAGLVALIQGTASSIDAFIGQQIQDGMNPRDAARIGRALLPFAASIGRDNAPSREFGHLSLPNHDMPSGLIR